MTLSGAPAAPSPQPCYLRLEIRFLNDTYSGTEWPPAPARLAQALVAGAESTTAPGLKWLENQPPPWILATDEPKGVWRRDYVPLNATPGNEARNARDRYIRREISPVSYLWPLPSLEDSRQAQALIATASHLTSLGAGQDMAHATGAIVSQSPASSGPQRLWRPGPTNLETEADHLLSAPAPGLMDELARRHGITRAGTQALHAHGHWSPQGGRSSANGSGFVSIAYRTTDAHPRTALKAFTLTRPDGTPATWRAGEAAIVAGMARHALIRCAGNDAELAAFAAGHPDSTCASSRAAVVPVPSTGHAHADGHIRRLLVTARSEDAHRLAQLLQRVPWSGLPLIDEESGELRAMAIPIQDCRAEPVLRQWLNPANCWASIQPVILPGMDSGELRRTHKLVRRALQHARLDPGLIERIDIDRMRGFLPQSVEYRDTRELLKTFP